MNLLQLLISTLASNDSVNSVAKKTYYITTAALNECDEYGGED